MYCPSCHSSCKDTDYYCFACGMPLGQPAPKQGSRLIPALLLILMSVIGLIVFFTAKDSTSADGCFIVDRGVLYFDESLYQGSSELVIPEAIDGISVRTISDGCFSGCASLTSVILPESLNSIGEHAFENCSSLRGIYIPASVRTIGKGAFSGCSALEAVCLHSRVQTIGYHAFSRCSHLNYIIFLGSYAQWCDLYDEDINPFVGIFCEDGSFFQGENKNN